MHGPKTKHRESVSDLVTVESIARHNSTVACKPDSRGCRDISRKDEWMSKLLGHDACRCPDCRLSTSHNRSVLLAKRHARNHHLKLVNMGIVGRLTVNAHSRCPFGAYCQHGTPNRSISPGS